MSYDAEAIQATMKLRAGFHLEELTEAALRQAGCLPTVAVLPEPFNERVRYLGDLLVQMVVKSKCGDDRLRHTVGTLAQSFSYLLNSSSWADGTLHEFDKDELSRKLRHIARAASNAN